MATELSIECRLAREYTLENIQDTLAYLLIKITPELKGHNTSLPLNISLVIDVSRSMKGEKINCVREAAKLLVNSLKNDDWVSVVAFSDDARAVVPITQAVDKSSILSAIDRIKIVNGTRMAYGMETSIREMRKAGTANKVNRMILLTDGETENESQCRIIAEQEYENHIMISSLGVGTRYNEVLLTDISDASLGSFYHLTTPQNVGEILQKEYEDASISVISDTILSFSLAPNVKLVSIDRIYPGCVRLQPKTAADGLSVNFEIGNIKGDEPTILGAQLKLPAEPSGRKKISGVTVNYNIPGLQLTNQQTSTEIFVEYTSNEELCGKVDREVVSYFNQLSTQQLVEQAIRDTRAGKIADATRSLVQAQSITQRLGNLPLAATIKEVKDELEQKGTISDDGIKTIKAGSRFTVRINNPEEKQGQTEKK